MTPWLSVSCVLIALVLLGLALHTALRERQAAARAMTPAPQPGPQPAPRKRAPRAAPTGLAGLWISADGTFTAIMDEAWWFWPDGTGRWTGAGLLSGEDREEFHWRSAGPGLVLITWDPEGLEPEEEAVPFAFEPARHEGGGTHLVLRTPGSRGLSRRGLAPLVAASFA